MRLRNLTPTINLMKEKHDFKEISFPNSNEFNESHIEASLELLFSGITPHLLAIENSRGDWSIVNGGNFMQGIIEYIKGDHMYPESGRIEELRGKAYKDLTRYQGRVLREYQADLCVCVPQEEDDDSEFPRVSQLLKALY